MNSNSNIQNSLFETMKIFSESAAANSGSTITIEGRITAIKDEAAGIYEVEYLGSTIEAHASSDTIYEVNDSVYILVPDGDFTKEKIILSLISASAKTYTSEIENNKNYYEISDNLIDNSLGTIKLSSYTTVKKNDNKTDISTQNNSVIGALFNDYLKTYRTFKFSFLAKTALPLEQQNSGNYGVSINIPIFKSIGMEGHGYSDQDWKTVYLETSNFVGTPYRFLEWAPQEICFSLDEQYTYDPTRMPYYSYYCYDFTQDETKANQFDIQIKDISLKVVKEISDEELSGYFLSLKASQGEYFSTYYNSTKTITPTLRVNGKTASLKNTEIYWFLEDTSVKADSEYYISYGGNGWKCLNTRSSTSYNEDGAKTYDYITSVQTYEISRAKVKAATRIKCVVIYNNNAYSAIITLKNLTVNESLLLTSSKNLAAVDGKYTVSETVENTYMKDVGLVDLAAIVYYDGITDKENYRDSIYFSWARYDKDGNYISSLGESFSSSSPSNWYDVTVLNQMAVVNNKNCYVTKIQFSVSEIEEWNTIYCTAKYCYVDNNGYKYEEQIGTKSINISTTEKKTLNLTIGGDNIIYKYDTNGNSPAGSVYDGPSTSKVTSIEPLTYTITHSGGEELSDSEYNFVHFKWSLPKNSLFTPVSDSFTSSDDNYYYYEGYGQKDYYSQLPYKIANRFNVSKSNAVISLEITLQDVILKKNVLISFIKEGMSGTNGSDYIVRLGVASGSTFYPYGSIDENGLAHKVKFVYNKKEEILYKVYIENNQEKLQKVANTQSIPTGIQVREWKDSAYGDNGNPIKGTLTMFDEEITEPCFSVISNGNSYNTYLSFDKTKVSESTCNIIQAKATVAGGSTAEADQVEYAYYPIELIITDYQPDFILALNGGYSEVIYATDGTNPSYDETSDFKFENYVLANLSDYSNSISDYFNISIDREIPPNKYDTGNSKHFIKANLSLKNKNKLEEDLKTYQILRDEYQSIMDSSYKNYTELNHAIDNFWYYFISENSSIKNTLNEIRPLLQIKSSAYEALIKIQDSIEDTLKYISLQEEYNENKVIIKETLSSFKAKVEKLIERVSSAQETVLKLTSINDLIDILPITIDDEKKWISNLGQEIVNILKIDINLINESISAYSLAESQLFLCQDSLNDYKGIKEKILKISNQISDDNSDYNNVKKLILGVYNNLDRGTSYTYLKNKISELKDIFSAYAIFYEDGYGWEAHDGLYTESQEKYQEYEEKVEDCIKTINCIQDMLGTDGHTFIYLRPIVYYFNRYAMSNINAWDGNKIETGDGGYILAPQVGAGVKNSDNSFTGIVMGARSTTSSVSYNNMKQTGLFGYSEGKQSLYLSAQTGASIFGVAGSGGQIIIDPSSRNGSSGAIYSSNYFKADGYDKTTGLPKSITRNTSGEGMLINFSEPSIKYGSGYFTVDKNGNLHAGGSGSGDVGGWYITDTTLQSGNYKAKKNGICLDAANDQITFGSNKGKIFSGQHIELNNTQDGFYLSQEGLSIGSKVKVTKDGTMYLGDGAVNGTSKHWEIDGGNGDSYIKYGNSGSSYSVYLGTGKLTLGSKFYVSAEDGSMRLGNGAVDNTRRHWTIDTNGKESYIAYGTYSFDDDSGIYFGTDGIRLSNDFSVDESGSLTSTDGKIGGWSIGKTTLQSNQLVLNSNGSITKTGSAYNWSIGTDGTATFKRLIASNSGEIGGWSINSYGLTGGKTTLSNDGTITCNNLIANTKGSIGGWAIGSSTLSGGFVTLNSDGSMNGNNWSISNKGIARFHDIIITGNGASALSSSGSSMNWGEGFSVSTTGKLTASSADVGGKITATSGSIGGCTISNGSLQVGDGHITDLSVDKLTVGGKKGSGLGWRTLSTVSGASLQAILSITVADDWCIPTEIEDGQVTSYLTLNNNICTGWASSKPLTLKLHTKNYGYVLAAESVEGTDISADTQTHL